MKKRLSGTFLLVPLFAASLYAQLATTTSLVGTVTDSSGKVIPNAKVTAVETGTLDTHSTLTNDVGYYAIDFVRVGTYNITVEQPGFQRVTKTGIQVDINQTVRTDIILSVGAVSQSVTVEAMVAAIKTDDAAVSEIISSRNVAELPLNGRDPMQLARTTPGVIQGLKATNGVPPGEDFIGAGTREIQNSLSLDGISILNNLITTTPTRPMVEAVQEVEVQTGTYSAQYGAYLGVHINMITKSGTNTVHGSAVEFVRNQVFDARNFFLLPTQANPTGSKPPLRQNQFGFELDGPVVLPKIYNGRDKTFFMGSYEGLRQLSQTASLGTVMPAAFFQGDFSSANVTVKDPLNGNAPFPGNIVPSGRISPVVAKLQQYYVAPNLAGLGNNYSTTVPNNNYTDQTVDRIDQNLGDKVRLYFRYQYQTENLLAGSAIPTNSSTSPVDMNNFTIGYTHTLTPRVVNEVRFGRQHFSTATLNYFYLNSASNAGTQLGIPGFNGDTSFNNPGIPEFNVSGFSGWGNSGTNWFQDDTTWQGTEQISWTHGSHSIMAGAEFRKLITGRAAINSPRGTFTFNGQLTGYAPADFVLGLPQSFTTPGPEIRNIVAEWRDGFFVLDKWQVSRKLTLNYGLRYELPTVAYTVNGNATELNPQQTALVPANAPQPGFHFYYPNHKNFAPRIGVAYRITDKTVFRGGYGIYYNPNQTNSFTFLNTNPPFSPVYTCTWSSGLTPVSLSNPLGVPAACPAPGIPNITTDNWNFPTAYMNQWSADLERQLWSGGGISLQYLGSHMLHLDRSYYNNTPLFPGPGAVNSRRPNPLFGVIRTIQNDEIANYQGLTVVYRQRMRYGLQMLASYTWSHTLDVSSDSNGGGTPMNPYNWREDYGNSNWDIRHRFVMSFVYDIPFFATSNPLVKGVFTKWQMNGIATFQTGFPYNVSISTDSANTGSSGTYRPNLVGTPTADCGAGHLIGCISTSAFALIPAGTYAYGSAGRNLLYGPGSETVDLSLFKNFPIHERLKFQFRFEMFSALNHPNFGNPTANFSAPTTFGNITSATGNRNIQLGGKLQF
jgi:hypothetical protein